MLTRATDLTIGLYRKHYRIFVGPDRNASVSLAPNSGWKSSDIGQCWITYGSHKIPGIPTFSDAFLSEGFVLGNLDLKDIHGGIGSIICVVRNLR